MAMASLSLHHLSPTPHPFKLSNSFFLRPQFHQAPPFKPLHPITLISCSYTPTPATDRLISAASYFFPLLHGVKYGYYVMEQYPILSVPLKTISPFISLYNPHPYATVISFFAVYLGIVRNPSFSRYVRFNALQALVLVVIMLLPFLIMIISFSVLVVRSVTHVLSSPVLMLRFLIQRMFPPGRVGLEVKLIAWMYYGLFVFVMGCFVYGVVSSVLGKTPYLPFIAKATGRQID